MPDVFFLCDRFFSIFAGASLSVSSFSDSATSNMSASSSESVSAESACCLPFFLVDLRAAHQILSAAKPKRVLMLISKAAAGCWLGLPEATTDSAL